MKTFLPANILLPKTCDPTRWSVIACDQYTSDRSYWKKTETLCADIPSTLHMIFPEVYLNDGDAETRTEAINRTMHKYLDSDVFYEQTDAFVYVERTLANGKIRRGVVGMFDLDDYDFTPGSQTRIRATEGTVRERIPPRVAIRKDAPLELPHIMILIDDDLRSVIEPLSRATEAEKPLYDFDLMFGSGHLKGKRVPPEAAQIMLQALDRLADPEQFEKKYRVSGKAPLVFAVGDGNHSLATAKVCREQFGKSRYALAELVNLHDDSLSFEPIHRVIFNVRPDDLTDALRSFFPSAHPATSPCPKPDAHRFSVVTKNGTGAWDIDKPIRNLPVGSVQDFLDFFVKETGATVDYIHDEEAVFSLVKNTPDTVGILLPAMQKNELFRTVILDGALPRKTFSMGHACDKRFYLECRKTDK